MWKSTDRLLHIAVFGTLPDLSNWLQWARSLSDRLHLPFDYLGRTRRCQSGHGKAIRYTWKKAAEAARDAATDGLDLYAARGPVVQLVFDWDLAVLWSEQASMLFVGCSEELCTFAEFTEIVKSIPLVLNSSYGFGGISEREFGPAFQAVGIGTGGPKNSGERAEMLRWSRELQGPRRFEEGMFRDVFSMNVLSERHLHQRLQGRELVACVARGDLPGELHPMGDTAVLWVLNESDIGQARTKLQDAGLILG